jgi:hypothetical protein
MSLIEMIVINRGSNPAITLEQVGIAASRDKANIGTNFGDSVLRIQVEFLTAGDNTGPGIGGWDGLVSGFVAAVGRPYGPGVAITPSTIGGSQYESRFDIVLSSGNWWVAHNGNWLGYYPGNLFNLIPSSAAEVDWYGEVFDPTPTDWTWTDMGSGLFASFGYGNAAYFKKPYYIDISGIAHWPDGSFNISPNDSTCYTRTNLLSGATPWDRYFYLGGPGGDALGCN